MITIKKIIENQRKFYEENKTKNLNFRKEQLKRLKKSIIKYEKEILQSLRKDLNKSDFEGYITEISMVLQEIDYTIKNLSKWMKPKKVRTPITQAISKSRIYAEPYGLALIIAPWNYPFQLIMTPLVGAMAAGNCVVLKPSPYSVHTSNIVEKIIKETFNEEYISIFQGDREVNKQLLEERFDYIFFTGGAGMGKVIMQAASKSLTPITLELGGKSPCIVDKTANIDLAAKRIIWGKLINSGQTCVAPDYLLVHSKVKYELIEKMKEYIIQFYGNTPLTSPDYPKIINKKHFNRLIDLMNHEDIIFGGDYNKDRNQIEPTIFDNITWESKIMEEEIFGPFIPILEFEDLDETITGINNKPKPLALYLFTRDKENETKLITNISYGGGCINDTIIHIATPYMPFGGVGNSGMGGYHGKWSFNLFSHKKSIMKKSNLLDLPFRYPPFNKDLNFIKKIMK